MALYKWNGKLLVKNGKLATHERCCCGEDGCPCIGCDVCPDHCLTIEQLLLSWGSAACNCPYVSFLFPPNASNIECVPDPACPSGTTCNDNVDNGKNCDWIDNCKWRLYGQWDCLIAPDEFVFPSLGFSNCGTVIAEAVNDTTWKFTVENGPEFCRDLDGNIEPDCVTEVEDPLGTVTLNITLLPANFVDTICETPPTNIEFGPDSVNANAGSSPNGCFSSGDITWSSADCCPTDGSSGGGGGGGGGGDPEGCCDGSETMTEAECDAQYGSWSSDPCEGYP
tara:strand:- start:74 stop:916 length:843 start_codon:yes stop_codon:yes gene_type:complete